MNDDDELIEFSTTGTIRDDLPMTVQNSANRHAGYRGGRHATSGANGTAQAGHYRTSRFGLGVLFVRPAGARSNG